MTFFSYSRVFCLCAWQVVVFGMGKSGKSTMINALLGEELLPSGTTTTTGNITKIGQIKNEAGKERVRLHRAGDPPDRWEEHDLQPVDSSPRVRHEWTVDMSIDRIEIEHRHEIFQHNVTIFDVPGYARGLVIVCLGGLLLRPRLTGLIR
eukprot:COSAG01_NODE_30029_length_624_cov_1.876190_1_plen_149_part_10